METFILPDMAVSGVYGVSHTFITQSRVQGRFYGLHFGKKMVVLETPSWIRYVNDEDNNNCQSIDHREELWTHTQPA